ncbi:MAG: hypothetical protein H6819_08875 [Phycisphaerales bacterium]|nr:hypothetical protein [Phycisphaerales bacterium]MCB9855659.1 hypothetical protein [Phycisphaerales bacterium]MCB9862555.1 hypothetical protein [Phycisphaerales bacterium]
MRLRDAAAILFVFAVAPVGCSHVNNPWVDSSTVVEDEMTTASAQGYSNKSEFSSNRWRTNWPAHEVAFENGAVSHWPLWFEDPFEDKGNRYQEVADEDAPDAVFAMNWVDYMHILYGPARFSMNSVLWPVSAVVTPPGTLMESDGRLSPSIIDRYDHDAKRSDSAMREPPFVNYLDGNGAGSMETDTAESSAP